MNINELKTELNTNIIAKEIVYFDEITSTNDIAFVLANDGAVDGTLVIANSQTMGKGRLDRKWFSPKGKSILASLILRPQIPLSHSGNINLITTLSIVHSIRSITNLNAMIKWPNDILLNERKVAGILCEVIEMKAVLGIGINLNIAEFPQDLKTVATSILKETKKRFDKMMIYNDLCYNLETNYALLKQDKAREILQQWRNYTVMFGKTVSIETPDKVIVGRVIDIGGNGSLVLALPDGKIEKVLAGECRIIRESK